MRLGNIDAFGQVRTSDPFNEVADGYVQIERDAEDLRVFASTIPSAIPSGPEGTKFLAELAVRAEVLARQLVALSGLGGSRFDVTRSAAQQAVAAALHAVESQLSGAALQRFRNNRNNTRRKDAWGPPKRGISAYRAITRGGEKTKEKLKLRRPSPAPSAPPPVAKDFIYDGSGRYGPMDTLYVRRMYVEGLYDPVTGVQATGTYQLVPMPPQYPKHTRRLSLQMIGGSSYIGFAKAREAAAPSELRGNHWVYKGATDTVYVESGWPHPMWETPPQFETHQAEGVEEMFEGKLHVPFRRGVPAQASPPPSYATIQTILPFPLSPLRPGYPTPPPPPRPGYTVARRR